MSRGFTLVELLITLAVAAIVMGLGMPSFKSLIENNRVAVNSSAFITSINRTRSEAVRRNARVTMCKSSDMNTCSDILKWEDGWIVYVDADNDGVKDADDTILEVNNGFSSTDTVRLNTGSVGNYISFTSTGTSRLFSGAIQSGRLVICVNSTISAYTRVIDINQTGRARRISATDAGVTSCGV